MNALAWLAATVASLWLSVYAFNTLSEAALGYATLVVFFLCLGTTVAEAWNDWGEKMKDMFS